MNINELTIGQAREIASLLGGVVGAEARATAAKSTPWRVGDAYFFRTVTMHWTGRIVAIHDGYLVLDEAAWIADSGRYHEATTADALNEVEPAGDGVILPLGGLIDARPWTGDLPSVAK